MTGDEISAALESEIAGLRDERVRAGIEAVRVLPPMRIELGWDYASVITQKRPKHDHLKTGQRE